MSNCKEISEDLRLAENLFLMGRYESAILVCRQILSKISEDDDGWGYLARQIIYCAENEANKISSDVHKRHRIVVVVIATGKYVVFLPPLIESIRKNFLNGHEINIIVFSDSYESNQIDVHVQKITRKGFPGDTLYRYHYFSSMYDVIKSYDYAFYFDADMLVCDEVGEEVLPQCGDTLVGVAHPGFFCRTNYFGTPETREISNAYIPQHKARYCYWAGGFNGGRADAFADMCVSIARAVDEDARRGLIAIWHDESHLNRYFSTHASVVKTLTPAYCYPQGHKMPMPLRQRIVALEKDHKEIRS